MATVGAAEEKEEEGSLLLLKLMGVPEGTPYDPVAKQMEITFLRFLGT